MSDPGSPDADVAASPAEVHVVWWRGPARVEVPRIHDVGWSTSDGARHGAVSVSSPHLRLDPATITSYLQTALATQLGRPVHAEPLAVANPDVSSQVHLLAAGHRLSDADLLGCYGLDVIAGVTAQHRGRGIAATVLLEQTLRLAVREAAARWAQAALEQFSEATVDTLRTRGWQQLTSDRWQLLAHQT